MYEEQLKQIEAIVKGVRQCAKELPGYRYDGGDPENTICLYRPTPENPNGCLIGYGARTAGTNLDEYEQDADAASVIQMELKILNDFPGTDTGQKIAHDLGWLDAVQSQQDESRSWAEAIDFADNHIRSYA